MDDFETTLTAQEINALLFTPVEDKKSRVLSECGNGSGNNSERTEIKESISALSEMWGRHELEILLMKKHQT